MYVHTFGWSFFLSIVFVIARIASFRLIQSRDIRFNQTPKSMGRLSINYARHETKTRGNDLRKHDVTSSITWLAPSSASSRSLLVARKSRQI